MPVIAIPKVLREKLSDEGADALAELLDKFTTKSEENMLERATDRFEKRIAQLEAKIAETESRIIKWTFVFVFGQFWAIVGVLFAFFRK